MFGSHRRNKERRLILKLAQTVPAIIASSEPYPCVNGCLDHLRWSCDQGPMHLVGALYPSGGWTCEITGLNESYERVAFVPDARLLLWDSPSSNRVITLDISELPQLMAGEIPDN